MTHRPEPKFKFLNLFNRIRVRLVNRFQSVIIFGISLILCIWIATLLLLKTEKEALERELERDAINISLVFEQNVISTVNDLDRILKFLRKTYERNGYKLDWPLYMKDEYTTDYSTVQIAVTDRLGMMITSSSMLYPKTPIDLSDREHFKIHLNSDKDDLFISKPVLGRASGKWSVQFTRRLMNEKGEFDGVVIISLDPSHLARVYSQLKLGDGNGLALVGTDGIVRAGSGTFGNMLGKNFLVSEEMSRSASEGTFIFHKIIDSGDILNVSREIQSISLKSVVAVPGIDNDTTWKRSYVMYISLAIILSAIAFICMIVASRRKLRHDLEMGKLARHDSLTNLYNRLLFREELDRLMTRPLTESNFALLIIDLDGFKLVNDTYGHTTGDQLLKAVAERLKAQVRNGDLVARFGGDEFAIIQRVRSFKADARALAERLCQVCSEPYKIGPLNLVVGMSIGIAGPSEVEHSSSELMKAADLALYAAKSKGRGNHQFYEEDMGIVALKRIALELGLRDAVERGELELHYQSINSIAKGAITGYEALLRWNHPKRGMIPPMEFIPVAEDTGMIVQIGAWVLQKACTEIASRSGQSRIAINCSPIQFKNSNFAETVRDALVSSGLQSNRLEIEITESILLEKNSQVMDQITQIQDMGVNISMDDFGTGYSCLSYIDNYPINTIKIDKSFIFKLGKIKSTKAIVRAIVELATGLGMDTIAEGVETVEQLEILRQLGCTQAQGYLFSKPARADEILEPIRSPTACDPVAA